MKTTSCPKNCDLDLPALAAGDLPRWRAVLLRRHLRVCACCAANYAEVETLFSQAQIAPHTSLAQMSDLQERTWARIEEEQTEQPIRLPASRFPKRRLLTVSLVGSAIAAGVVAATLLLPPGAPLAPTPSFAMVAKAMAEAQSLEFRMVETTDYDKPPFHFVRDTRIALRLNPLTIATARSNSQFFTHSDEKESYTNTGIFWEGKPEVDVNPPRSAATLRKVIRNSMSFKSDQQGLGTAFHWSAAKRVRLDGRPALRFDASNSQPSLRPGNRYDSPLNVTVWVDPTTLHFLRYETIQRIDDSITQKSVASEYVYDQPDAHSLLTKSLPVVTPIALSGGIPSATTMETQKARAVVNAALSAWARGDRNQFAAYCDAGDPVWNQPVAPTSHLPLDTEIPVATWNRLVEMHNRQPSSEIESVTKMAIYTLVRLSAQEAVPSELPSNVLVAQTNNATFYLKQTSDAGLKIFHVTCTGKPASKPGESRAVVSWP